MPPDDLMMGFTDCLVKLVKPLVDGCENESHSYVDSCCAWRRGVVGWQVHSIHLGSVLDGP